MYRGDPLNADLATSIYKRVNVNGGANLQRELRLRRREYRYCGIVAQRDTDFLSGNLANPPEEILQVGGFLGWADDGVWRGWHNSLRLCFSRHQEPQNLKLPVTGNENLAVGNRGNNVRITASCVCPSARLDRDQLSCEIGGRERVQSDGDAWIGVGGSVWSLNKPHYGGIRCSAV